MTNLDPVKTRKITSEAMINLPLSALRYLSAYPSEKKVVIEISTDDIKRVNKAETLDEIINEAKLDYALGNFKTFTTARDLIAELHT
ncbi:hypothetical protein KBD81_05885 [Candidatus Woesebacteria bacterium]|nr:hypothetical protein [Candidatus Woesebacteria bacterium]